MNNDISVISKQIDALEKKVAILKEITSGHYAMLRTSKEKIVELEEICRAQTEAIQLLTKGIALLSNEDEDE